MSEHISYTDLLASMRRQKDGSSEVTIPVNWMQGRTTYGGLSAALCLQAVEHSYQDLPPLRSAQINFVGPAGGRVEISDSELRRGKSVAYIESRMHGEQGLATHCVFAFGAPRKSHLLGDFTPRPAVAGPADSEDFFKNGPGPVFTSEFECRLSEGALPISGTDKTEFYIWIRHRDQTPTNDVTLLSIADMPPPAVLPMFKQPAPVSSMTWMMNFLQNNPQTEGGWWLMRSAAEHARDGYSSQDMQVWNTNGDLVISGRQNVALFY